jgi:cell division protein FtsI/penicillin-binding protein 2
VTPLAEHRLRLVLVLTVIGFALVIGRAIELQAVSADELLSKARDQQQVTIEIPVTRGTIRDRNGLPIAQQGVSKQLLARPAEIEDPEATAAFIAQKLGYTKRKAQRRMVERLLPALTAEGVQQAVVLHQLDPDKVAGILADDPPGLFAIDEPRRDYPFRKLAAQVLGYTDIDLHGRPNGAGLEYLLDPVLRGMPGERLEVRAPGGAPMESFTLAEPKQGRDVTLTIDQVIQTKVQAVLDATARRWRAHSATAIVLDPRTGEVLAIANAPGYDNNQVHNLPEKQFEELTRNRAVQDAYEPGSTFKVVTMAAALDSGLVYPSMKFHNLPYARRVGDRVIHDDVERGPITLTAAQILQQSSNIGTVTIAEIVGKETLSEWIERFGFGHRSSLGLFDEQRGSVLPPEDWYDSSIGNIPIGQGISVTPIQMASMYAAIANDGVLVEPHIVRSIEGRKPTQPNHRRILTPVVDHQLVNMLKGVVDTAAGTGVRARVAGYTVAGKTGTAQKAVPGGYSKVNYVASFVGFLPADDPEVEVMVVVDSPRGNIFGGVVAAPAFQEIATFLTQALSIRPDRPFE